MIILIQKLKHDYSCKSTMQYQRAIIYLVLDQTLVQNKVLLYAVEPKLYFFHPFRVGVVSNYLLKLFASEFANVSAVFFEEISKTKLINSNFTLFECQKAPEANTALFILNNKKKSPAL